MQMQTRLRLSVAASLMLSVVVGGIIFLAMRDMSLEAARSRTYSEIRSRINALNVTTARFQSRR